MQRHPPGRLCGDLSNMSSPAVDTQHLTHRYGDRTALRDVTLQIEDGELFGLLGPNGGGKTTLFHILSSLLIPSEGRATIFGCDSVTQADASRRHIGFVFQQTALDEALTVEENLAFHGALYGLRGESLRARIADLLTLFGLSARADDRAGALSGGLRRRVDLARGILHAPSLLLLDEPTSGLDPGARRTLWETLGRLRRTEGTTIIAATHLMEEAEECDRVGIIDHGKIVALGAPRDLTDALGTTMLWLHSPAAEELRDRIHAQFGLDARTAGDRVQIAHDDAPAILGALYEAFGGRIESSAIRKLSLEDVFLTRTGHDLDALEHQQDMSTRRARRGETPHVGDLSLRSK